MKTDITIAAEARETRGKNEARRLRVRGLAPAVVYGAGNGAVAVAVSPREISKILHSKTGTNTIFNLAVQGGETTPVMVVDTQSDPIRSNLLHVDLKRIDLTKRIAVKIPVHTKGDPKGVKVQGGLLEVVTREVEIDCLPDEIPNEFVMDVSELNIGQSLRASDIPMSGSMKLVSSPELVLAHVVALKAEAAAPAAEGAATTTAEPEVIKKGKKEEEGAAPAAGEKAKKK
jgi:large subunit ribosomal protein L25